MERSLLGQAVATYSIENITKVLLPQRLPAIIRRDRLVSALQRNIDRRLSVVVAPAGYGKTTLVVDFVNSIDVPVCWLSLDESDRDWQAFLGYLVTSIQQRFPAFGLEILSKLRQDIITLTDADKLLGLLVTEMFSAIPDYFIIVLDDFHYLDDVPEVRTLVENLLYKMPDNCHLVVASRTQPPLSNLPRLLVQRQALRLNPSDLAFTQEEVRRFLRDAQGMEISSEEAQEIVEATEGWAAGLILLAANPALLSTPGGLQAHGLPADLFEYLANEIYAQQPHDIQSFLIQTSILTEFNADLCNELLSISDSERILGLLEQRSLFLTRLQGSRPWYKYHPLFREFLLTKFKGESPHNLERLNSRAGAIQERSGQWSEAVRHYIASHNWEAVANIVDRGARRILEEGKWQTLASWIEALPEEALRERPRLALWWAKALFHTNQLDLALQKVTDIIPRLMGQEDWAAVGEALICKGACLRLKGKYEDAISACKEACSLLLHYDCPASKVAEARQELGVSYGMQGQFTQALEELNNALAIYEPRGDTYNAAAVNDHIGITLSALGRLPEAAGHFEKARQGWLALNNETKLASTLNNMGMVFYLQGEYKTAMDLFQESLQRARSVGERRVEAYALASLADIKREQGAFDAAIELYNLCQELARKLQESFLLAYAIDGLGNAYRLLGDLAKAEVLVKEAGAEAADKGALYELGLYQTSMGLIHRQRGEKEQAVACFEEAASLLERSGAKREQARAYFHWAEALFSFGRKSRSKAMSLLENVAALTKDLGYYHFLLADVSQSPLIVQYAAAKDVGDGLFRQLQARIMERNRPVTADAVSAGGSTRKLPVVKAQALGSAQVFIDNRTVSDLEWRSEKSREMFFYLLTQSKPLRKEQIAAAIWPDLPEENINSSFHSSLHRLRRALYPECVIQDNGWYRLNPAGVFLYDVAKFQELINKAEETAKGSEAWADLLEQAVELYHGPFAEEFYSEWAEPLRGQLEQKYLRALSALASYYASRNEHQKGISLCERILAVDSLQEDAWYQMMQGYLALGERGAALHCYRKYSELLEEELGVEPPPKITNLYQRAISG